MCNKYTYQKNMFKISVFIYMLLSGILCFSQKDSVRNLNIKLKTIRYTSAFLAGFSEGTMDAISFHYHSFQKRHPNADAQFWDPSISWENKWKNGDPAQGEKYLGSSTIFVPFQDAWHGLKGGKTMFTISSTIIIPIGEKKTWKWYAKEIAIGYLANRAGFYTSYNSIYK